MGWHRASAWSLLGLLAACGGPAAPSRQLPPGVPKSVTIELGPLRIAGIYRSMDGPYERLPFLFDDVGWITGFRTRVVDAWTGEPLGEQFFCHSQLQLHNSTRLLVTATGMSEIRFPEGFAMPLHRILAHMPPQSRGASVLGMVLNNYEPDMDREVKLRVEIDYLPAGDPLAERTLRKLYKVELPVSLSGDYDALGGEPLRPVELERYKGLRGHWLVPPGRQIVRQRHRHIVPVPASVHFALAHLHNHGRRIRVRDRTTGEVLWTTEVAYEPERVQIARIPPYASATGFPLHSEHEYEVEAEYENTARQPVDAMAAVYLFYHPEGNVDVAYGAPTAGSR